METSNHECYISLDVAKLLKEAGFDWKCRCYYETSGKFRGKNSGSFINYNSPLIWQNNGNTDTQLYSAPTLDVAQRWLREVYHFHITTTPDNVEFETWGWTIFTSNYVKYNTYCQGYSTYEEALEAGIKNALEIILEKGE